MEAKYTPIYKILSILICLFVVLPIYFKIGPFTVYTYVAVLILLLVVCTQSMKLNSGFNIKTKYGSLYLFVIIQIILFLATQDYINLLELLIFPVGIGMVIVSVYKSKNSFINLLSSLTVLFFIISGLGILEEIIRITPFSLLNTTGTTISYNPLRFGLLRIISSQSHTIAYCVFCNFEASLVLYYRTLSVISCKRKRFALITYWLVIINSILTLSRSALLCLIASQFVLWYLCGFRKLISNIIRYSLMASPLIIMLVLLFPEIRSAITSFIAMILVVFDNSYASAIQNSFGQDNLYGIGNRLELYGWVLAEVKNHLFFGYGMDSIFVYRYYDWTKTGCEVYYLSELYKQGVIGLTSVLLVIISLLKTTFINRKSKLDVETKIGFNQVGFVVILSYLLSLFAVDQGSEKRLFYIIMFMIIIYNKLLKREVISK